MKHTTTLKLIVLVLVATALRLPYLGSTQINGDEGDGWDTVKAYLEKGTSPWERLVFTPPPFMWLIAFFAHFFGLNPITLRLTSFIFGTLTPLLIYFLTKRFFANEEKAFLAGLLTTVIPFFVLASRDAHYEATQIFFVLLAIITLEHYLENNCNKILNFRIILAIVTTGAAFSIKYNSMMLLGVYWLFNIGYALKESRKNFARLLKQALAINAGAFLILVLMTGFSRLRLAYLFYGVIFWTINQSTQANVPWYYYFSVLFEGLSPLLFALFFASIIAQIKQAITKDTERTAILPFFVTIITLTIVFLQARKYPRHLMLAMPFAIMIIADTLIRIKTAMAKRKELFYFLLICAIVVSTGMFSVNKINGYKNYTFWKEVGEYALKNSNENSTIYVHGTEYWPVIVYTNYERKISSALDASTNTNRLKNNDLVVIHQIDKTKSFFIGSPLQNDLTIYSEEYAKQYHFNTTFYDWAKTNGKIIKKIDYDKKGNKIILVRLNSTSPKSTARKIKLDNATQKICDVLNSNDVIINWLKKFSQELYAKVNKKCTYGCVDTCGMF